MPDNQMQAVCQADKALIEACGFANMRITSVEKDHEQGERHATSGSPEITSKYILQDEIFGDGEVCIKLHLKGSFVFKAEIGYHENYRSACESWAKTIKSEIPQIQILFAKLPEA